MAPANDGFEGLDMTAGGDIPRNASLDGLLKLLLEQVRANNRELERSRDNHDRVIEALATAKAQLESGAKSFEEIRATQGRLDGRVRALEAEVVTRPVCEARHRGSSTFTQWAVMALIALSAIIIPIIARAQEVAMGADPVTIDPGMILSLLTNPAGAATAIGIVVYAIVEIVLKGAFHLSKPWFKRTAALGMGVILGALASMIPEATYGVAVGVVAGFVGTLMVVVARWSGKAIRDKPCDKDGCGNGSAAIAILATALFLGSCGHLTPAQEADLKAGGIDCGVLAGTQALACAPACFAASDPRACSLACTESTIKIASAECAERLAAAGSEGLGNAMRDLVEAMIQVYDEAKALVGVSLTPEAEAALKAGGLECGVLAASQSLACAASCLVATDGKACSIACIESTIKIVSPDCAEKLASTGSQGLGAAVKDLVEAAIKVYDEAMRLTDPPADPDPTLDTGSAPG
jgi:hypothetical protein